MARPASTSAPRIGLVSLGCAKALYDSERIVTRLRAEGYEFADGYAGADAVVVNTCGFLDSARAESLEAIGEALAENGKVIVTGCLGKHPDLIRAAHPGVLAISGPADYAAVIDAVHKVRPPVHDPYADLIPEGGLKLTPRHYAWLKISEGCNNRCSFCIIPSMRGRLKSRPPGEVLAEARALVRAGVKELLIVSQDTGAYGLDLRRSAAGPVRPHIVDLARALGGLGVWVRLHYVYPYPHIDALIELMAEGAILPYIDAPFQHASPAVLKAMRRPGDRDKMLERIRAWRAVCPDLAIRSTFIVGFPGETEADFQLLLDWLEEAQIDRAGCFVYEPVAGAAANALGDHVPADVARERHARFMAVQARISAARLAAMKGAEVDVIVDEVTDEAVVGRTIWDAPEVDGRITLPPVAGLKPGDIYTARIIGADDTDLYGRWAVADGE